MAATLGRRRPDLLPAPTVPDVRWSSPAQWMVKVRPLGHVDELRFEDLAVLPMSAG